MFGEHYDPPRRPRYEPLLLLLIAIAVAAVTTFGYIAIKMFWASAPPS
jgi:hypothetical protein